jgi:predicted dehydrogenase
MRIAVIGTGSVGRRHLGNLVGLEKVDAVAVSENGRLEKLEIEGRNVPVLHSAAEAYKDADAVVIANPTVFHRPYLQDALEAGCHVYLEKPAGTSAEGLDELADLADEKGLVVAMGTQNRFHDRLDDLRTALAAGEAGQILNVVANLGEHIADYHPGEDYRQSYTARAELGGGILLTQIHQIDYLNWLFGPFSRVAAVGGKQSDLDIDVEDNVTYLLQGASGVPVVGHLDYLQRPKRVSLELYGTARSYRWDYFANRLETTAAALNAVPQISESPFDRNALFRRAMANFLGAIETGTAPRSTLRDGIAALRIVDAIRQACETHNTIRIMENR